MPTTLSFRATVVAPAMGGKTDASYVWPVWPCMAMAYGSVVSVSLIIAIRLGVKCVRTHEKKVNGAKAYLHFLSSGNDESKHEGSDVIDEELRPFVL